MRPYAVHTICANQDYEFIFEEFRDDEDQQIMLAHISVVHFSPAVLKRMRREWREIRAATSAPLYAIEPNFQDAKWERFVQPFGFQYFSTVDPGEGLRRMFVSRAETTFNELQQERNEHHSGHFPERHAD